MPDAHECRVDFEHVRKVLGALRSEGVLIYTENNGNLALGGADGVNGARSKPRVSGGWVLALYGALEILDGGVDFERFRQVLCAL